MKPGLYPSMPIADYIADPCPEPSLSSSIANVLVDQSPAHAFVAHPRLTPKPNAEWSAVANFGSAVHSLVFGGPKVHSLAFKDYRKDAAKEERDRIVSLGEIPLLADEYDRAHAVAHHADAALSALYGDRLMAFESTIIWRRSDVWCRTRADAISDSRRLIVDLKVTGVSIGNGGANRQFFNQGYDMQAAFLERGADSIDPEGRGRRRIVYLFVENEPPFASLPLLVSEATLMIARKRLNAAVNLWRECLRSGTWPGYPAEPQSTDRPGWQESAWLAREIEGSVNVEAGDEVVS